MRQPVVASTAEIDALLQQDQPVALGVSGGKDSTALAFATCAYLDSRGHTGPRVLVHSDLGRVEWTQSADVCAQLAERLGLELVVVRRQAGDMMDRWLTRWANNVVRYSNLECVKLILPWSTPAMRFCTSEMKVAVICRELVRRFPSSTIVSASGIRRQESPGRAKAPVAKPQAKLSSRSQATAGWDWHPILDYTLDDVRAVHREHDFPMHEAYTKYGATRVSCAFCIMSSRADLLASSAHPDHTSLFREMVQLEATSTFAFQSGGWLADTAPSLLDPALAEAVRVAKQSAIIREALESRIPSHLLYSKGWPTCMPTQAEADLLAETRKGVAAVVGIPVLYTESTEILARYAQLMARNAERRH